MAQPSTLLVIQEHSDFYLLAHLRCPGSTNELVELPYLATFVIADDSSQFSSYSVTSSGKLLVIAGAEVTTECTQTASFGISAQILSPTEMIGN